MARRQPSGRGGWLRVVVDRGQRLPVIAAGADLATPYYGGVALARARVRTCSPFRVEATLLSYARRASPSI